MKLDSKEQQTLLLEMIKSINIQGQILDTMYELKQTIINAEIQRNEPLTTEKIVKEKRL